MKYIKLFEDIDFDDIDYEEENDNLSGTYYLIRKSGNKEICLQKVKLELVRKNRYGTGIYDYIDYESGEVIWASMSEYDVKEDMKFPKFNHIRLFRLDEWGTERVINEFKRLFGYDLPEEYTGKIVEEIN